MIEQAKSGNNSMFDDLNEEWDRLAPINFLYERGTNHSKEISRKLKEHYLHGKPASIENSEGLARVSISYIFYHHHNAPRRVS